MNTDPPARPASITLMRHAEKTGRKGDCSLSEKGWARASALVQLLPQRIGGIGFIITARTSRRSRRPRETVAALAEALDLPVDERFDTKDCSALAATLLGEARYAGQHVLVCWRHDGLPRLARAMGAEGAGRWPGSLYGVLWRLVPGEAGAALTVLDDGFAG